MDFQYDQLVLGCSQRSHQGMCRYRGQLVMIHPHEDVDPARNVIHGTKAIRVKINAFHLVDVAFKFIPVYAGLPAEHCKRYRQTLRAGVQAPEYYLSQPIQQIRYTG